MANCILTETLSDRIYRLADRMGCSPQEAMRQAIEDQECLLDELEATGSPTGPLIHNRDGFAALFPVDAESPRRY